MGLRSGRLAFQRRYASTTRPSYLWKSHCENRKTNCSDLLVGNRSGVLAFGDKLSAVLRATCTLPMRKKIPLIPLSGLVLESITFSLQLPFHPLTSHQECRTENSCKVAAYTSIA